MSNGREDHHVLCKTWSLVRVYSEVRYSNTGQLDIHNGGNISRGATGDGSAPAKLQKQIIAGRSWLV
jgi:hypothetical protein